MKKKIRIVKPILRHVNEVYYKGYIIDKNICYLSVLQLKSTIEETIVWIM